MDELNGCITQLIGLILAMASTAFAVVAAKYYFDGSDLWFSRMALSLILIGLVYAGDARSG